MLHSGCTAEEFPRFYPILDTAVIRSRGLDLYAVAQTLLDLGVRILQFRHKTDFTQLIFDQAADVRQLCRRYDATFVMNDRADFAKLLDCALHLGQEDLPASAARTVVGEFGVIGLSTHNTAQFSEAIAEPADYIAMGPIYATRSKENPDPIVGAEFIRECRPRTNRPLIAIGGIGIEQAPGVYEAGANAIALISGFLPERGSEAGALAQNIRQWMKAGS